MIDKEIISNGVDIIKVDRIRKILKRPYKDAFLKKIFNTEEIEYFKNNKYDAKSISGYFAVKEAIMKTLKKGMDKTSFKDITILKIILTTINNTTAVTAYTTFFDKFSACSGNILFSN